MATAIGTSPDLLADVPQLVALLTFNEKVQPTTRDERIQHYVRLTALGRQAAASPATRALILYSSERVLQPGAFLQLTQPSATHPVSPLLVWLDLRASDAEVKTHGLDVFGLPEIVVSMGPKPTESDAQDVTGAIFTVANQMLATQSQPPDGHVFGEQGTSYEVRAEGTMIRVTRRESEKPSLWKRLFR